MGLPVRQRRVLERIENTLRGSDPRLAALYAIFARLTRDEEMPRIEQLRHSAARLVLRLRLALAFLGTRLFGRLIPRQRGVLFFPLAVGLAVASIVFAVKSSSGPQCGQIAPPNAVAGHAHPSKLCKSEPEPLGFAH
jgi:hypothetical protein